MTPTPPAEGLTAQQIAHGQRLIAEHAHTREECSVATWLVNNAPALLALAEKALGPTGRAEYPECTCPSQPCARFEHADCCPVRLAMNAPTPDVRERARGLSPCDGWVQGTYAQHEFICRNALGGRPECDLCPGCIRADAIAVELSRLEGERDEARAHPGRADTDCDKHGKYVATTCIGCRDDAVAALAAKTAECVKLRVVLAAGEEYAQHSLLCLRARDEHLRRGVVPTCICSFNDALARLTTRDTGGTRK